MFEESNSNVGILTRNAKGNTKLAASVQESSVNVVASNESWKKTQASVKQKTATDGKDFKVD
jgi:hypothetical protein